MTICIYLNGVKLCITIPIYPLPGLGDLPETNWATISGQTAGWARELQSLATIVVIARRSPEVFRGLHAGINQLVEHVQSQLPEGVSIHVTE